MRVWVLLGKHQFAAALDLARALNKQIPDDVQVYGFLTDAHVELGNYKEAEEACQWMLDLRPGNMPALTRASYLRELFGDIEGSIELMQAAYQRTPPDEKEDRVWLLTQLGHLELMAGRFENAERLLHEALQVIPDYHYALANLARLRSAQNRHDEAARLLKQRYDNAPHPENLYDLAEALERAGRAAEARTAYAEFEKRALKEAEGWDNANRQLIFYYARHAGKPEEALRIARMEIARRQDVYTLDAYAWALYANSDHRQARDQISRVLAVGTKDPGGCSKSTDYLHAQQRFRRFSLTRGDGAYSILSAKAQSRRGMHGPDRRILCGLRKRAMREASPSWRDVDVQSSFILERQPGAELNVTRRSR